jgi:hypothetical protein
MTPEQIGSLVMLDTLGLSVHDMDPDKLTNKSVQLGAGDEKKHSWESRFNAIGKRTYTVNAVKSRRRFDVEGSPALHHQGHNVVSSGDVPMLAFTMLRDLNRFGDWEIPLDRALQFANGKGSEVTRLDMPVLLRKPPHIDTSALVNGIAMSGIAAGLNMSVYINKSVYFDQHSQLISLKVYDKAAHLAKLRKSKIPQTPATELLMDLARRTLRLEAVFRGKWLKRRYPGGAAPEIFTREELGKLLLEVLERYDLRRDIRKGLLEEDLYRLPPVFRPAVAAWQAGFSALRALHGDTELLEKAAAYMQANWSIDIKGPPPGDLPYAIEVGELFSPSNFVPAPPELLADGALFHHLDLSCARADLQRRLGETVT